jgi:DTW domain-containing protein
MGEPRLVCDRCRRPASVCYCAHITALETATRVLLLQHPRERDVAIGTARIARLCLPRSELRIGVDFERDPVVQAALKARAYLLYPGPSAIDIDLERLPQPLTLIVVDGTWWQAKKLLKLNPALAALPQIRFTPPRGSDYRIRREPAAHCVATIEALAHVLGALEGDPGRFQALLRPFNAMVDTQIHFATNVRSSRQKRGPARKSLAPRRATLPGLLRDRPSDVVCVHAEANAWPIHRPGGHPAEIVQWLARRPATGETFEAVIAPRRPLAPSTPTHTRLSAERLAEGEAWGAFTERWAAFTRASDVLCAWGRYPIDLLEQCGVAVSSARLDVRPAASAFLGQRTGGVEECVERLGAPSPSAWAEGRGGIRMAALCAVIDRMMSEAALTP